MVRVEAAMKRTWLALRLALSLLLPASAASARDPFEITADMGLGADTFVVVMTFAPATALRLVTGRQAPRALLTSDTFPSYAAELERLAPSLYELTSRGRTLQFRTASAKLTDEHDVELVVTYDRPEGTLLNARARGLAMLSEGYTVAVSLSHAGIRGARFRLLTAADSALDIPLPPAAGLRESPGPLELGGAPLSRAAWLVIPLSLVLVGWAYSARRR
jgi:hypothetical protein